MKCNTNKTKSAKQLIVHNKSLHQRFPNFPSHLQPSGEWQTKQPPPLATTIFSTSAPIVQWHVSCISSIISTWPFSFCPSLSFINSLTHCLQENVGLTWPENMHGQLGLPPGPFWDMAGVLHLSWHTNKVMWFFLNYFYAKLFLVGGVWGHI